MTQLSRLLSLCTVVLTILCLSSCAGPKPIANNINLTDVPEPGIVTTDINLQKIADFPDDFTPQELAHCHAVRQSPQLEYNDLATLNQNWSQPEAKKLNPNLAAIKKRGHLIIGIDPHAPPFSHTLPNVNGLFVQWAEDINAALFPGDSKPEFRMVRNYEDQRNALESHEIDISLTPFPMTCTENTKVHYSVPIHRTEVAIAHLDPSGPELTKDTFPMCLPNNPVVDRLALIHYYRARPQFSPTVADCIVLTQQGPNTAIAGSLEELLSFSGQATMEHITIGAPIYFSVATPNDDPDLTNLVDQAILNIRTNPYQQIELRNTLVRAYILPDLWAAPSCEYSVESLNKKIHNSANIPSLRRIIESNFELGFTPSLGQLSLCTS